MKLVLLLSLKTFIVLMLCGTSMAATPFHPKIPQQAEIPPQLKVSLAKLWQAHATRAKHAHLTELARSLGITADLIGVGVGGVGVHVLTSDSSIEMLSKLATINQDLNLPPLDASDTAAALGIETEEAQRLQYLYGFVWLANDMLSPAAGNGMEKVLDNYKLVLPDFAKTLRQARAMIPNKQQVSTEDVAHDDLSWWQKIRARRTERATSPPPEEIEPQSTHRRAASGRAARNSGSLATGIGTDAGHRASLHRSRPR